MFTTVSMGKKRSRSSKEETRTVKRRRTMLQNYPQTPYGRKAGKGEIKSLQTAITHTGTNNLTVVNAMDAGPAINEREGRQITAKSLHIVGRIGVGAGATTGNGAVRILVIYDSSRNGANDPALTDILDDNSTNGFMNLDNRRRFTVFRNYATGFIVHVGNYISGGSDPYVDMFIPLKDRVTIYNNDSTAGTPDGTGIQSGAWYVVVLSDADAGSFKFTGRARLRYTDN